MTLRSNSTKKILVIQLKMIGDVLISSIICNNLKTHYPEAQVDFLIYPFTKPVVENNPNIDNIVLFPEAARESKLELLKFVMQLRKQRYDVVIDAYSKLESCLITMGSGASRRIGYQGKGVPFSYNEKVDYPELPKTTNGLAIERRQKLIEALIAAPLDLHPKIYLTVAERATAKATIEDHGIDLVHDTLVMASILGSEQSKTYPPKYMAQLLDRVAQFENVKILFNYIPKQAKDAQNIYDLCAPETRKKIVFDLIGTDLRSFMALMDYCKMIIGNDGGAINIAKALNKPSFTIFSPWIEKISWNIFEDGKFHKAVHLNDYNNKAIADKSRKTLQKEYAHFYLMLEPQLILPELHVFLQDHLATQSE